MAVFTLIERSSIQVCGPEAVHFLHNLVTTDIEGLPEGEIRPGALLSPQGKILFDFLVSRSGDRFSLECRSDIAAELAKRLKFYRLRAKVEIELLEQALVSASVDADSSASENDSTAQWLLDGRFFGSIKVYRSYSASAAKVDLERTYDALRIAHGVAEGGSDYEFGDAFPHDANLDQTRGLSFSKGCYVGQEVVSRMQHRNTARRRTVLVTANDDLAARAAVTAGGRKIGKLGTVVGFKALALVRIDKAKEAMDAGTPVFADHVKINVDLPPQVTFGWPDSGEVLE